MSLTLTIGNKNYSSWSLRPWIAMTHFGLTFEEWRIPLYEPDTRDRILQRSPSGRIPALTDGDLTLWDSLAILEYLAERFPGAWWPTDLAQRALARSVSAEMHSGFMALRQHMPMNCRSRYPGKGRSPEVLKDIERITEIWRSCLSQSGGSFLFGDFSIADAMYAPVVSRFITYGVELDRLCQAYADAIWSLPAMQAWVEAAIAESEVLEVYEAPYR